MTCDKAVHYDILYIVNRWIERLHVHSVTIIRTDVLVEHWSDLLPYKQPGGLFLRAQTLTSTDELIRVWCSKVKVTDIRSIQLL